MAVALLLTVVGGLLTGVTSLVDLPDVVVLAALPLFLAGTLVALVLAYWEARRSHVSVPRAIGRALKLAFRWLFFFMP